MRQIIRSIYKKLPFKQPFYEFLRNFVSPGENVWKHLHFEGDFHVRIDEAHAFWIRHHGFELENTLFWKGVSEGWEKTSISLWIELVKQSKVIFDIGANTGVYSLIARSLNREAQVYAFEPLSWVFEKLEENNRLNNYDIACFEYAASNTDGATTLYSERYDGYSVTLNKNFYSPDAKLEGMEINAARLDTFIEEMQIENIDLMKIDVETHEPEVLEGLGKYLKKFKPTMIIEVLNDEIGEKIEALVEGNNYLYFNLDEASGSIRRVEKITKSDYYNYLICGEKEAKTLKLTTEVNHKK